MRKKNQKIANAEDQVVSHLAGLLQSGKPLMGQEGAFTPLIKRALEAALQGEMDAFLAQQPPSASNRRNGRTSKRLKSASGANLEVFTPRDRNADFEPELIKKRQRRLPDEVDRKVISLYANGLSYRDIQSHLQDIYGVELAVGTLTAITDQIMPEITQWQQRPLQRMYPVVWLDAMHFKVRQEGKVITKAVYNVLGVDANGVKELLGVYFGQNESASFWRNVLTELQQRGLQDVLICCVDNLKGFSEAIEDHFPQAYVQLCLVHQMRNASKYATWKDLRPLMKDLKAIYQAATLSQAAQQLQLAEATWGGKYKMIFRSWHANWEQLMGFMCFPPELRRLIYTTNPIESFHRMVRKVTKTKGAYTNEKAIVKHIYLAIQNAQTRWKGTIRGWKTIQLDLTEHFGQRFTNNDTV